MGIFDFIGNKDKKPLSNEENQKPTLIELFGAIDIDKLEDYYHTSVIVEGLNVEIDLNFETSSIDSETAKQIEQFIFQLDKLNKLIHGYIHEDFKKEVSMTTDYLNFYIDELDDAELSNIVDADESNSFEASSLLNKLTLIRVGIYPKASYFATFDYSIYIDDEPCNQLLVVNVKENGTLDRITWES